MPDFETEDPTAPTAPQTLAQTMEELRAPELASSERPTLNIRPPVRLNGGES